jgi:hypothetical protein
LLRDIDNLEREIRELKELVTPVKQRPALFDCDGGCGQRIAVFGSTCSKCATVVEQDCEKKLQASRAQARRFAVLVSSLPGHESDCACVDCNTIREAIQLLKEVDS